MQQNPPCSTPIKETQHRRTPNKTNKMPRLGPCNTEHKQTKHNARIRAMQHVGKPVKGQGKDHHPRRRQRLHRHPTTPQAPNDSTGTPLTVEEATTAGRLKSLEKDRQMESQTRLYPSDHHSSARTNSTKTKVITGLPDEIFTKVQQIHKDSGSDNQLVRAEAEENMPTKKSRTHERKTEQQRLEPGENTLGKGAEKEQMLQRLHRRPTKTRRGNWQSKRNKTLCGV